MVRGMGVQTGVQAGAQWGAEVLQLGRTDTMVRGYEGCSGTVVRGIAVGLWLGVSGYRLGCRQGDSGEQRHCSWDARTPCTDTMVRAVGSAGSRG